VLPRTIIDHELKILKIKGVSLSRQLGLIHLSERTLNNAAIAFLNMLKDTP